MTDNEPSNAAEESAGRKHAIQESRQRLRLQRMDRALVRAYLAVPDALPEADYESLRYALGLARLHVFRPATAGPAGDVAVDRERIAPLRGWLLEHLYDHLRGDAAPEDKLAACREAISEVRAQAIDLRRDLLASHVDDFDAAALDREAGRRALVTVAGGGGGAGYVYVGAFARLMEEGLIPDYMVGNSIGAILGLFRAQRRHGDVSDYLDFARKLKNGDIFTAARRRSEFCLPGLLHLHLRALHQRMATGDLRRPLRLDEMEIPLDLVVAGIRRRPYERLPSDVRAPNEGAERWLPIWRARSQPTGGPGRCSPSASRMASIWPMSSPRPATARPHWRFMMNYAKPPHRCWHPIYRARACYSNGVPPTPPPRACTRPKQRSIRISTPAATLLRPGRALAPTSGRLRATRRCWLRRRLMPVPRRDWAAPIRAWVSSRPRHGISNGRSIWMTVWAGSMRP